MAEYRTANQSLVLLAQRDLADFWGALNLNLPERTRDALLDFYPELVAAYGDAAALLGADWYDALRDVPPSATSFKAALARPVDTEQAQGVVRWGAGGLFADNPPSTLAALSGAAQRLVLQPGRDTFADAAVEDGQMRFGRVTSGKDTCDFCVGLAGRGLVYPTRENAGSFNSWHDDCDCVIISGRN